MKLLISGATGLIGSRLSAVLRERGDEVVALSRSDRPGSVQWNPQAASLNPKLLAGYDAIIHLAAENIAGRWTKNKKKRIWNSRVHGTRILAQAIAETDAPPAVFISASAVGYYGSPGDQKVNESAPSGSNFFGRLASQWEGAAHLAARPETRVVSPRLGIVLTPEGGALKAMLLPFKLGLGGPVGNGKQWLSWITLEDAVRALLHCLDDQRVKGAVNLTTPAPVTNRDFSQALAHTLHRPAFLPVPPFALKLVVGDLVDEALVTSIRAMPDALQRIGFHFHHPQLKPALEAMLKK